MLVFSAITPHPPLSIPTIGKENAVKVQQSTEALEKLGKDLYAAQPDVIITISPHGDIIPDAFSINLRGTYKMNFEELGEFITSKEFNDAPLLTMEIKEKIMYDLPLQFVSNEKLDYGTSIPLFHMTKELPEIALIPINYSLLDNKTHFEFGQLLKDVIANSEKRIAVIASADLSHTLAQKGGPAPYAAEGEQFDKDIVELLKAKDIQRIVNLDEGLIAKAQEDGLRSIIILMGILSEYQFETDILSYEAPLGVGYLTAKFELK